MVNLVNGVNFGVQGSLLSRGAVMSGVAGVGRRKRVRAATVEEIKTTARRLLIEQGPQNVTLRAIAREMGMTAPGLYRYFPSHEDLWTQLCHDTYEALADAVEAGRDRVPVGDAPTRLLAATWAFRDWAVGHPREFGLVFGAPLPGVQELLAAGGPAEMRFSLVFTETFVELWEQQPFDVPAEENLPPGLAPQLRTYWDALVPAFPAAAGLPLGAVYVFLVAWVQLYGVVAMEVFGHLRFCLEDSAPFFESQLLHLADLLGIEHEGLLPRP